MRVCVVVVVVGVCAWGVAGGLASTTTTPPPHTPPHLPQAQDCVPYGGVADQEAPSKRFQHRVTVEVTPPAGSLPVSGGVLILKSLTTSRKCRLMLLGPIAAVSCSGGHGEGGHGVGGQGLGGQGLGGQGLGGQGVGGQGLGGQGVGGQGLGGQGLGGQGVGGQGLGGQGLSGQGLGGQGLGGQGLGGQDVGRLGVGGQGVSRLGVGGQGNGGQAKQTWPMDILKQGEDTELWVQVGGTSGAPPDTLVVVGRRAGHQGHLILPSSGLLPPLTLTTTNLRHYYNCITGCKYGRSTKTQPGYDTVYLQPDSTFLNLSLAYTTEKGVRVYLNLTSDDLGVEAGSSGVREVKVFWDGELGTIGATVDDKRVENNRRWSKLGEKQEVEATVEGGGVVAACDLTFLGQMDVEQCEGDADEGDADGGSTDEGGADEGSTDGGSTDGGGADEGNADESDADEGDADGGSTAAERATNPGIAVALGIMVTLALIFLASSLAFAYLYYRASRRLRIITGGLARGPKRGSTRKRSIKNDDADGGSASEVTAALSDTVTTPALTPGSLNVPRSPAMVSSKDFVSLDLM